MPTASPDAVTVLLPRPLLAMPLRHPQWTVAGVAVLSALTTSAVFVGAALVVLLLWPSSPPPADRVVAGTPALPAMPVDDLDAW